MIVLIRSLIVYCLLLALPYQGYAAAAMMACLPATSDVAVDVAAGIAADVAVAPAAAHMTMPAGPHDHAAMLAAIDNEQSAQSRLAHTHPAHAQPDDGSAHAGHTNGSGKCGGSACCIGGAAVLNHLLSVPALPAVSSAIALYSGYLPAVDLAHPERPPQA